MHWNDLEVLLPAATLAALEAENKEALLKELLGEFDAEHTGVLDLSQASMLLHALETSDLLRHCADEVATKRAPLSSTREDIDEVFVALDSAFVFPSMGLNFTAIGRFATVLQKRGASARAVVRSRSEASAHAKAPAVAAPRPSAAPPTASAPVVPMPAPRPPSATAARPPPAAAPRGTAAAAAASVRAPRPPPAEAPAAATRAAPVAGAPRPPPAAAPTPLAAVRALRQDQRAPEPAPPQQRPAPPQDPMAQLRGALAETSLVGLLPALFPPTAAYRVSRVTFRDVLAAALYPPPVVAPPTFDDAQRRLFEAIAAGDARQAQSPPLVGVGAHAEWLTRINTLSGLSVLCMGESDMVNMLFSECDTNSSGFLDRTEFAAYVRMVLVMSLTLNGTGHPLHGMRALEAGTQLSRAIFDLIDTNRSDAISRPEFSQWFGAVVACWAHGESRSLSEAIQMSVGSTSTPAAGRPLPPPPQPQWGMQPGVEAPPVDGLANSVERRTSQGGRQPVRHKGRVARGERKHRGSVFHGMVKDVTALHKDHTSGLIHPQPAYFEKKASTGLRRWQKRWFKLSNNYLVYRSVTHARLCFPPQPSSSNSPIMLPRARLSARLSLRLARRILARTSTPRRRARARSIFGRSRTS